MQKVRRKKCFHNDRNFRTNILGFTKSKPLSCRRLPIQSITPTNIDHCSVVSSPWSSQCLTMLDLNLRYLNSFLFEFLSAKGVNLSIY